MSDLLTALGSAGLIAWLVLVLGRGGFWRVAPVLPSPDGAVPAASVVAVVPARNEAAVLPTTLPSLLGQDAPGPFRVLLVDDRSEDATAQVAREIAAARPERLEVLEAPALEPGWTGKLWAVSRGIAAASAGDDPPEYLLLTDADIGHPPDSVRSLVALARAEDLDLVSVMAKLRALTFWERAIVPAFVYFFAKLFPFRWVGTPGARTAAAAGGCVLIRREALERAGGIESIRGAIIDDVALGTAVKRRGREAGGRIWLGFRPEIESRRGYDGLDELWQMVARTAFTQLGHSTLLLVGTVVGMALVYAGPPIAFLGGLAIGSPGATLLGGLAWALQAGSYVPMLRHYGLPAWHALGLPLVAGLYLAMTIDSARQTWRGRGGAWKGRTY